MRRAASLALVLVACASDPSVAFRVVEVGDDPFFGGTATAIAVSVEQNGIRDDASTVLFAPGTRTLKLPSLPFGDGYALVVETNLANTVLARGRSFPFSVATSGPSRTPDVSLGVLGRFASVASIDASDPPLLVMPTDDGAVIATARGTIHFVAHGPDARPTAGQLVAWPASRVGAALGALGSGVLAVGGAAAGASWIDADGHVLAELGAGTLSTTSGAVLASIDATHAIVIGGTRGDGSSSADVTLVTAGGGPLSATSLAPLGAPRTEARAIVLTARSGTAVVPRVLVLDGRGPSGDALDLVLLDPSDATPPRSVALASLARNAAACALDVGLVLLAGGDDSTGRPTGAITILVVQPDQSPPIAALSPSPPTLFDPRSGAAAVPLGAGLALVVGGVAADGTPIEDAEIAEVRLDFLPGDVVLTGSLGGAGTVTAGAPLGDHTLLVASGGALSLYFSPRDTSP